MLFMPDCPVVVSKRLKNCQLANVTVKLNVGLPLLAVITSSTKIKKKFTVLIITGISIKQFAQKIRKIDGGILECFVRLGFVLINFGLGQLELESQNGKF